MFLGEIKRQRSRTKRHHSVVVSSYLTHNPSITTVVRGHKDRKRVKKIKEEVKEYERKVAEMLQQVEELGRSLVRQQEILCQTDKDAAKGMR